MDSRSECAENATTLCGNEIRIMKLSYGECYSRKLPNPCMHGKTDAINGDDDDVDIEIGYELCGRMRVIIMHI